jgi:hypothetical protein
MAQRGRPLDAYTIAQIQRLRPVLSLRKTAREADVAQNTVIKYSKTIRRPTQK